MCALISQINHLYSCIPILVDHNPVKVLNSLLVVIMKVTKHIDLCCIEYSFGDAWTALKHGKEACLHIWHLMWISYIVSPKLSCELLTDKMNLLKKSFSAIWFLTIGTTWENSDFAWVNLFKLFSKINWSYNRHNVSAARNSFQNWIYIALIVCKMKVLSVASTWCIRFWHTIYRHQMMTQILESTYN